MMTNFYRIFGRLLLVSGFGLGVTLVHAQSVSGFGFKDYHKTVRPKVIPPDAIASRAALLVDGQTGEVLYARNPDEKHLPASVTKLLTGLIVFEKIGFTGNVTIVESDKAEPSNVPLIPGETVSVKQLMHAMLINSDNDAARALARHTAGSVSAFVDMMNQRAQQLGCINTHFANPNGLPEPGGIPAMHTSCSDLMKIFRAVIAHPELRKICTLKQYEISTASGNKILHNHNILLGRYPGMGPAKTGWTIASRHTYAAAVERDGRELDLTIMDSPDKWRDAIILLNWGFSQQPNVPASTSTK